MEWNSGEKKIEINSKTVIESTKLKFDSVKSIDKINWKDGKKRGGCRETNTSKNENENVTTDRIFKW